MSRLDRAIARVLPAVPRPVVRRLVVAVHRRPDARRRRARRPPAERARGSSRRSTCSARRSRAPAEAARDRRGSTTACSRGSRREGLDANISVKLTGLGLELDGELCRANLEALVDDARARGNFVRIDMEDSSTTDATLGLYRELRAAGHENVGVVLQACLRRTLADVAGARQRPALQGDLRRAARARLPGRRRDPRRASSRRSTRCSTQGATSGSRRTTRR